MATAVSATGYIWHSFLSFHHTPVVEFIYDASIRRINPHWQFLRDVSIFDDKLMEPIKQEAHIGVPEKKTVVDDDSDHERVDDEGDDDDSEEEEEDEEEDEAERQKRLDAARQAAKEKELKAKAQQKMKDLESSDWMKKLKGNRKFNSVYQFRF